LVSLEKNIGGNRIIMEKKLIIKKVKKKGKTLKKVSILDNI
jgi:hypothetical protein